MLARLTLVALAVVLAGSASAAIVTLQNANATLTIDPLSDAGHSAWTVDGRDVLAKQWFWYRSGTMAEACIDTIAMPTAIATDGDGDGLNDRLVLVYTNSLFRLTVDQILTGGSAGSGTSDLAMVIKVTNLTNAPLDFHLFQFADLDLNGSAANDRVWFSSGNTVEQMKGPYWACQSAVTMPNHHAVGLNGSILASLTDGVASTLDDSNGAVTGDSEWALQWDFNIGAGKTAIVSQDLLTVPEPATMALLSLASIVLLRRRRG